MSFLITWSCAHLPNYCPLLYEDPQPCFIYQGTSGLVEAFLLPPFGFLLQLLPNNTIPVKQSPTQNCQSQWLEIQIPGHHPRPMAWDSAFFPTPEALLGGHRYFRTIVKCATHVNVTQTSVTYTV